MPKMKKITNSIAALEYEGDHIMIEFFEKFDGHTDKTKRRLHLQRLKNDTWSVAIHTELTCTREKLFDSADEMTTHLINRYNIEIPLQGKNYIRSKMQLVKCIYRPRPFSGTQTLSSTQWNALKLAGWKIDWKTEASKKFKTREDMIREFREITGCSPQFGTVTTII